MSLRTAVCGAIVSLFLVGLVGAARAEDRAAARKHYERALALINVGDPRSAIEEFGRAYVDAPLPSFLYNIGHEYEALGREGRSESDLRQATVFFTRYLQARPDADDRQAVERSIADLEIEIAVLARARADAHDAGPGDGGVSGAVSVPPSPIAPSTAPLLIPAGATPEARAPRRWPIWLGVGGGALLAGIGVTLAVVLTRPHETILMPLDLNK